MKGFRFRYDSILQMHIRRRDEAGMDVAQAIAALNKIQAQIDDLENQRQQSRFVAKSQMTGQGWSVDGMLRHSRYDLQLQAEQHGLKQTLAKLAEELQRRRDHLASVQTDVKTFERLRETQTETFRQDAMRREQAESDDLTSARMLMSRRTIDRDRNG